MKLEITNRKDNPLFNRVEVVFEVRHDVETPSRSSVICELAKALKTDESLIVVDYIRQPFGVKMCYGKAKAYKSAEAMKVEPKHLLERAKKSIVKPEAVEGAEPKEVPKPADEAKEKAKPKAEGKPQSKAEIDEPLPAGGAKEGIEPEPEDKPEPKAEEDNGQSA